jgi:hypothetical protein
MNFFAFTLWKIRFAASTSALGFVTKTGASQTIVHDGFLVEIRSVSCEKLPRSPCKILIISGLLIPKPSARPVYLSPSPHAIFE